MRITRRQAVAVALVYASVAVAAQSQTVLYRCPTATCSDPITAWFDHIYLGPPAGDADCEPGNCLKYDGDSDFPYDDHRGTDFGAVDGAELFAGADGTVVGSVTHCPEDGSEPHCGSYFGNHVRIQHLDGNVTIYAHMEQGTPLLEGYEPKCGDPIGRVGLSGQTTGFHVHMELQRCVICDYTNDLDLFGGVANGGFSYWTTPNTPNTTCHNFEPSIAVVEPNGSQEVAVRSYTITWIDEDLDDNAEISLYYDDDPSTPGDGTLIVSGLSEDDPLDRFLWDTTSVANGSYFIEAVISDGMSTSSAYSASPVTISNCEAEVTGEIIDFIRVVTACNSVSVGPDVEVVDGGNLIIQALSTLFRNGFSVLAGATTSVEAEAELGSFVPNALYLIDAINNDLLQLVGTSSTQVVGPLDRTTLNGLAYDRVNDRLYSSDRETDELVELSTVDATTLGTIQLTGDMERGIVGMTFGPENALYGVAATVGSNSRLVKINIETGVVTTWSTLLPPPLTDVVYDHDTERMFAISPGNFGLFYEVDLATAEITLIRNTGLTGVGWLADRANSELLWASRSRNFPNRTDLGTLTSTGGFSSLLILGPQGRVNGIESVYLPLE